MSDVVNNHLKYWTKEPASPLGLRVAELLDVWDGLHHFDQAQMKKVAWSHPYFIKLNIGNEIASFDGNQMTRLVFLAHDFCLRVAVSPCNPRYLTLLFHSRKREGGFSERHPTLEQAVARWRELHPEHPASTLAEDPAA